MATDRTAIVTGAGGALGGSVAEAFQGAGWNLGLFDYGEENARRLGEAFPDAVVRSVDLTKEEPTGESTSAVVERFGAVDALLAIAGGFAMGKAHEASLADLDRMLNLNVRTLFNSVRAVLPEMRERGNGFILGVSAGAGLGASPGMAAYAASKSAVATYLASVRAEVKENGVRVTTLYPMDGLDTPANRAAMPETDPSGWIDVDALAATILRIAAGDPRAHVDELRVASTQ